MSDAQRNSQQPKQAQPRAKQKHSFAACLRKCRLHSPEIIAGWLDDHDQEKDNELASKLVREGHLTSWQAKYLISGRHRLHLGNYQLLERIRRDEFGDRFIALHPNLGRQVLIQILPVQLTDNEHQRGAFLKRAGRVGDLDHPNLAHVFDIDHDQGRYFLVTEHAAGQLLADRSEGSLKAVEIGQIVRDAIAGLKYAHAQELTHGRVSPQSLLVTESGATKVTQMALSPLAEVTPATSQIAANGRVLSPAQEDLATTVEIGQSLVQQSVALGDRSKLDAMLSALSESVDDADCFERSFAKLTEWVDSNAAPIVINAGRSDESPQAITATASATLEESKTPFDVAPEPVSVPGQANASSEAQTAATAQAEAKHDQARPRPTAWLLLGISAMSLLIGGLGVASFSWLNGGQVASKTTTPRSIAQHEPLVPASVDPPPAPSPEPLVPTPFKTDRSSTDELTPSSESNPPKPPAMLSPEASKTRTPRGSELVSPLLKDRKPSVVPARPSPASSPPKAATKPPTKKQADTRKKNVPTTKPEIAKPPTGPFDQLPNAVDLPQVDSLVAAELATIPTRSNYLLGLELIAPEGVARGKTVFELVRGEQDKQRWTLTVKRSPKAEGRQIGQLSYSTDNQKLQFQWTDEAAASKHADYVRNTALKLTVASESRTLNLRRPLKLNDLKITPKKMQAHIEAAVEHLPQPEMITVELLPWKAAGLPKSWLEPSIIRSGQPASIHFHEAISNRFCWLQLNSDIRNEVNLNLHLLLKHADGSVVPIESAEQLKVLASSIKKAARVYEQEYEAKKGYVAPKGQKTKFKTYLAKVKSNMTKAKKQTVIATQNVEILSSVYGRTIPLRILFRAGDHRVVLADTTLTE